MENRLRNQGKMTAPATAPAPKQPNKNPYAAELSAISWRASTGSRDHRALAHRTKRPVRTSTARNAGA
jgi:hypothetical protein